MKCAKCGEAIPEGEVFRHGGKDYCEDCFIDIRSVPKTCDPMKVRPAKLTRERFNQSGTEGLLPIQKELYEYLKKHGKANREDIAREFELTPKELEKHFSVLRHCELVRGFKENNQIFMTTMDNDSA